MRDAACWAILLDWGISIYPHAIPLFPPPPINISVLTPYSISSMLPRWVNTPTPLWRTHPPPVTITAYQRLIPPPNVLIPAPLLWINSPHDSRYWPPPVVPHFSSQGPILSPLAPVSRFRSCGSIYPTIQILTPTSEPYLHTYGSSSPTKPAIAPYPWAVSPQLWVNFPPRIQILPSPSEPYLHTWGSILPHHSHTSHPLWAIFSPFASRYWPQYAVSPTVMHLPFSPYSSCGVSSPPMTPKLPPFTYPARYDPKVSWLLDLQTLQLRSHTMPA